MPAKGAVLLPLLLAGCGVPFTTLEADGPAAARVVELWWVMFAGAMLILIGVMAAALYSLKPRRAGRNVSDKAMLVGGGLIFPIVTLTALMAFAFLRGEKLLARDDAGVTVIDGVARQWFWEFNYADGTRTVGALHVPAGEPFHLRVTSDDVIHSFWIPRLGGKMDAIPGKVNRLALQADRPGFYRGICAEFCGIGHAHMIFDVHAHEPADYAAALAQAAGQPLAEPLPILLRRREPAQERIRSAADYLMRWVGARE